MQRKFHGLTAALIRSTIISLLGTLMSSGIHLLRGDEQRFEVIGPQVMGIAFPLISFTRQIPVSEDMKFMLVLNMVIGVFLLIVLLQGMLGPGRERPRPRPLE